MIFVDTSAFHAVLDADDSHHKAAVRIWTIPLTRNLPIFTSNYVVVETCALVQRRLGLAALRAFRNDILPLIDVIWIDRRLHEIAMASLVASNRRKLSLVDCSSFLLMHESGSDTAFAFDTHFREEGFSSDFS